MITYFQTKDVRIHSQIVNSLGNPCKFYYYLRLIDMLGSGKAKFHIMECLDDLKISRSTFFLYLNKSSMIRKYYVKDGVYTVYYTAAAKLAVARGLKSLGAIAKVDFQKDIVSNWRQTVHLLEALILQKQSKAKATLTEIENGKKGKAQPRVIAEVEEVFFALDKIKQRSYDFSLCRGVTVRPFSIFINAKETASFGGAQSTVADRLGCSSRTTRKHLANVSKIRQANSSNNTKAEADYFRFISTEDKSNIAGKYFTYDLYEKSRTNEQRASALAINKYQKNDTWVNTVCLYEEVFQLESVKGLRATFNRLSAAQDSAVPFPA